MLTKITIHNFKKFKEKTEIPLGNGFVFVGPNNSRKTTALQALTLWHTGLQSLINKGKALPKLFLETPKEKQPKLKEIKHGVTINRANLVFLPTSQSKELWHNTKIHAGGGDGQIRIHIIVEGNDNGEDWKCGLEFQYVNKESFFCRPLRAGKEQKPTPIPREATWVKTVLLPPMSGLAMTEALIQPGRINVLLGEGRTAEVLRNICYSILEQGGDNWNSLQKSIKEFFNVELEKPVFNPLGGDITCKYKEGGVSFGLQNAGRGMQQVMLLISFLYYHEKGMVLLMDEPDAHLETLRQQQVYSRLCKIAEDRNSQIIVASHSEKILDDAGSRDSAVAFLPGGSPFVLGANQKADVKKSLNEIGYTDYYNAEMKKWVLYLEGRTDLRIFIAFAKRLKHPAYAVLSSDTLFCSFTETDNEKAKYRHFNSLKIAVPKLAGIMITDKQRDGGVPQKMEHISWKKREIENYLCTRNTLIAYVGGNPVDSHGKQRQEIMKEEIAKMESSLKYLRQESMFSSDVLASEHMTSLFENYAETLKSQSLMQNTNASPLLKRDFYRLVDFIPKKEIDAEITQKLDAIYKTAMSAKTGKGKK